MKVSLRFPEENETQERLHQSLCIRHPYPNKKYSRVWRSIPGSYLKAGAVDDQDEGTNTRRSTPCLFGAIANNAKTAIGEAVPAAGWGTVTTVAFIFASESIFCLRQPLSINANFNILSDP